MSVVFRSAFLLISACLLALYTGCGGDDGNAGATASLSWDPVADPKISYTVHYGTKSAGEPGSCNYENSLNVSEPFAMVTGLAFNTVYYFAVSASTDNGSRSNCSNEVSKVT
jgi:Fibronectin type III domain